MTPPVTRPRALCIAGPTAAGKTAAVLALAEAFPLEIISVDSALVYRGMDIGTAKPNAAELAAVPHHLIDIVDPAHSYSAARFVADAQALMVAIQQRGRIALLVGGTMLYFKALLEGLDELPLADPTIRAALEQQAREQGWPALHAELARVDPVTAARLPPTDAQRIQRALEVYRISGQPLSGFFTKDKTVVAQPADLPLLSLEPIERGWLHQRIDERFAAMLQQGLIDEVRQLRARGDLHLGLPAMRCVGYRQVWEAFDAAQALGLDDLNAAQVREVQLRGSAATRQLAKRQLTWLRSLPARHIVACDQAQVQKQVRDWVQAHL